MAVRKYDVYAAEFGGHLFLDFFSYERGVMAPWLIASVSTTEESVDRLSPDILPEHLVIVELLGSVYIGSVSESESDIASRWVHRESNLNE